MFNKKNWWWIALIAVIVIVVLWVVGFYNSVINLNESVDNQWAQVETQYQRRFDLIPNLVASVKGVLTQEQTVFGDIADARTKYAGATTVNDKVGAATQVESALARLLVIMENYPVLKSNETVQALMVQLEGTENRISVERKRFNDIVKLYNVKIKTFPSNILAKVFGFDVRNFFEAVEGSEKAPTVDLNVTK
ncbi:MAG: lemA protein [Parcubacteria group bacterium GW2011_GWC2_39_14]|nr:MAG: lemA protein [Parcubacteria group bacterium GW2011_GWC2_39_14]KKR54585.1 MAG: lemA protein [Parcubacteria group bacterium GW2011_GWA2_40_23]